MKEQVPNASFLFICNQPAELSVIFRSSTGAILTFAWFQTAVILMSAFS